MIDGAKINGTSTILSMHPFFHVCGGFMPFHAMMFGCEILLTHNCRDYSQILSWGVERGMTWTGAVPTVLNLMVNEMKKDPTKFLPLKGKLSMLVGGSAVPFTTVKYLYQEWDIKLYHGWGMTEAFPPSLAGFIQTKADGNKTVAEQIDNICKQGMFNNMMDAKLVDETNDDISIPKDGKTPGEILVRGPGVTTRYYKIKKPSNFKNGWIKTGDIGIITPNNVLTITDRKKDLIKTGGEWISTIDMENFVQSLDEIALACCVGVHHPKWDERPILVVQLHPNKSITKDEILKYIGRKYARFQIPDDVLFWDSIPLTATNKVSKKTVRQILKKKWICITNIKIKIVILYFIFIIFIRYMLVCNLRYILCIKKQKFNTKS